MPTTEIFQCQLKAGSNIGDAQNEAAKVVKAIGDKLKVTPGVQQIQFGMQIEKPDFFQLFVTWDNITAHQTFMKTEEYQPFLAHVLSVVSGPAGMLHVDFEPSDTFTKATISAPVTEVATFYFDPSSSSATATTPEANVLKFRDVVNAAGKEIDGFWGAAAGVSHETDVKSLSTEGVSGTAVVLVLGWESVEKHMAFRETSIFKDNVHLFAEGVKELEVHHVPFLEFVQ